MYTMQKPVALDILPDGQSFVAIVPHEWSVPQSKRHLMRGIGGLTMRDRLIELLCFRFPVNLPNVMGGYDTIGERILSRGDRENLADHLIANGVTVQEWISADDPPKENGDYFIHTQDGYLGTAYYKYGRWLAGGSVVTHWMPLPQPPKGE